MRAHAAGIPAFFTPTGASTAVEEGTIPQRYKEGGAVNGIEIPGIPKEAREINGKRYVLETALGGDVAFIRAWKVDEVGNCVFRYATHGIAIVTSVTYFFWKICRSKLQRSHGQKCETDHRRGKAFPITDGSSHVSLLVYIYIFI